MTLLTFINSGTALIALTLMLLVTIGFAPHLKMRGHDADNLMSLFVAACSGLVWVRILWSSILYPIAGELGLMDPMVISTFGHIIRIGFNVWAIVAALAGLGALHRSLPVSEQANYSWLTVPFFPRRISVIWRS